MKKLLLLILCGWVAVLWSQEYPVTADTRFNPAQLQVPTDRIQLPLSVASEPSWKVLEQMDVAERQNSLINVELSTSASEQAQSIARSIENLWNASQFNEALALFNQLAEKVSWNDIAIGRSWKMPLSNQNGEMWGEDVRIGTRDSIRTTAFDIHRTSGNLFAILLYHEGSRDYWSANYSTDGGTTWYETFTWYATYTINSMDAAIVGDYCYVGFSRGPSQDQAFLYRFYVYDGMQTNFSTGYSYHTVFTTTSGIYIKEVSLSANQDFFNNRLYYSAILSDMTIKFYWGYIPDDVSWTPIINSVNNADRGLDITCNENFSDYFQWITYIGNNNWVYINGINSLDQWIFVTQANVGSSAMYSAVSAWSDTVTAVFENTGNHIYCRYYVSYNGGNNWNQGMLDDTTNALEAPSITARDGGGVAMVYRYYTPTREGRYRWRNYIGSWSAPEKFTDNEPYWVQPAIEYIGGGDYGVVYLSWYSPYERAAYFDRLSWTLAAPQNLTALTGYHNSIVLAWDAPLDKSENNLLNQVNQVSKHLSAVPEEKNISAAVHSPVKFSPGSGGGESSNQVVISGSQNRPHTEAELLSYNIYRGTIASGPYDFLANTDKQYYRDQSAVNGTIYYYVVEAVYDAGVSGYSTESSAMAVLNGNIIRAEAASTAPTIDGVINAAEWSQATTTQITAPGSTYPVMLYSMNDLNYLYLALDDPNNNVMNDYDEFGIYFDEDNNFEWPPSSPSGEGNFWIDYYLTGPSTARFRGISGWWPLNLLFDSPIDAQAVVHGISFGTGHVQFEVRIDLSASPLNVSPGNSLGFYVFSYDYGTGAMNGYWPEETFYYWPLPASYGTLILDPVVGIEEPQQSLITAYELLPNYPNPFNPSTTIHYRLANTQAQPTILAIYNSSGQLIQTLVDQPQNNGEYSVTWDGLNSQGLEVGSGVYFYQLKSGDFTQTHKLLKMK